MSASIVARQEGARYAVRLPESVYGAGAISVRTGLRLTMSDGSIWIHPYDGSAPFKVEDDIREGF